MSDIFREVEEDLRRDRLQHVWRKYGVWVIGAAAAVIALVAVATWWNAHQRSQAEEAARAYIAADRIAADGEIAEAAARFQALAEERGGGYAMVSGLRAAALLSEADRRDEAIAAYDALAAESADPILSDLAALRAALLLSEVASADELAVRLAPLAREGGAWRFTALELLAFAALRAGDRQEAAARYREIAEAAAPPRVRERARTMLRGLEVAGTGEGRGSVRPAPADAGADADAAAPGDGE